MHETPANKKPPPPKNKQEAVGVIIDSESLRRLAELELIEIAEKAKEAKPGLPLAGDEAREIGSAQQKKLAELAIEKTALENLSFSSDIAARKVYAERLFRAIAFWILGIFILLLLQGFCDGHQNTLDLTVRGNRLVLRPQFHLAETVLLAVIGGTTVNIIGLFYVVTNYLFPTKKKDSN